jgi:hypothetical protein
MGARFDLPPHGGLPMTVHGGALRDIEWNSEISQRSDKERAATRRRRRRRHVSSPSRRSRAITRSECSSARGIPVKSTGTRVEVCR